MANGYSDDGDDDTNNNKIDLRAEIFNIKQINKII